jgi:hypothetical protein
VVVVVVVVDTPEEEEKEPIKTHNSSTIHLLKKCSTSSNYTVLLMQ